MKREKTKPYGKNTTPIKYEYNGKFYTVKDLARLTGWCVNNVYYFLDTCRNMDEFFEKANHKKRSKFNYTYRGKSYTLSELTDICNASTVFIYNKVRKNKMSIEEIVEYQRSKGRIK